VGDDPEPAVLIVMEQAFNCRVNKLTKQVNKMTLNMCTFIISPFYWNKEKNKLSITISLHQFLRINGQAKKLH